MTFCPHMDFGKRWVLRKWIWKRPGHCSWFRRRVLRSAPMILDIADIRYPFFPKSLILFTWDMLSIFLSSFDQIGLFSKDMSIGDDFQYVLLFMRNSPISKWGFFDAFFGILSVLHTKKSKVVVTLTVREARLLREWLLKKTERACQKRRPDRRP